MYWCSTKWNSLEKQQQKTFLVIEKNETFFQVDYIIELKTGKNSVLILVLLLNVHLTLSKLCLFFFLQKGEESLLQKILRLIGGKSSGRPTCCYDDIASVLALLDKSMCKGYVALWYEMFMYLESYYQL